MNFFFAEIWKRPASAECLVTQEIFRPRPCQEIFRPRPDPPAGLKGFTPVGPRPTESVLSPQGYASKELFANFEEIVPLDFGKPSGKSRL